MGYSTSALRGVSWMGFFRIATRMLTFGRLAVMGRILSPLEFGYFGIATLLLSILEIVTETGVNIVLIQHEKTIDEFIDAAFIVSIVRGILISLLLFLLAPFIALFFNSKAATGIIMLTALVPLIRGFINPSIISYQKELLFKNEFRLRTSLFVVDVIVSVISVLIYRSAFSFTFGLIASAILEVLVSYLLFAVRPHFTLDASKIIMILKRGWWVTVTGIFSYFADNSDNIAVGKLIGTSSLGIYQVAYKFSTIPISEITNVVNQVIFPVYTKFSREKVRLRDAFIKVTLASTIAAVCIGTFIYVFARPIILFTMGDKWLIAIPAIQILSIYGILRTIFGNGAPLFLSLGRQDIVAKMTLIRVLSLGVLVIPLVEKYSMVGAGYAMLVSIICEIPIVLYYAKKELL
jgi:O-antigen/teichoic acid export membrane protein